MCLCRWSIVFRYRKFIHLYRGSRGHRSIMFNWTQWNPLSLLLGTRFSSTNEIPFASVCLSVCLSVTRVSLAQTANFFPKYVFTWIWVYCKKDRENNYSQLFFSRGCYIEMGVVKQRFGSIDGYVSDMVSDRDKLLYH